MTTFDSDARRALADGRHGDPHSVLGAHPYDAGGVSGVIIRVHQPEAADCFVIRDGVSTAMRDESDGFFSLVIAGARLPLRYGLRFIASDGRTWERGDAYRHLPTTVD